MEKTEKMVTTVELLTYIMLMVALFYRLMVVEKEEKLTMVKGHQVLIVVVMD